MKTFFTNDNKKRKKDNEKKEKKKKILQHSTFYIFLFPATFTSYISRGILPSVFTLIQPLLLVLLRQLIQLNLVSRPAFFIRAEARGEAGVVPPEILPVLYGLGHRLVRCLGQVHGQEAGNKGDETEENGGHFGIQRVEQHDGGCQGAAETGAHRSYPQTGVPHHGGEQLGSVIVNNGERARYVRLAEQNDPDDRRPRQIGSARWYHGRCYAAHASDQHERGDHAPSPHPIHQETDHHVGGHLDQAAEEQHEEGIADQVARVQ